MKLDYETSSEPHVSSIFHFESTLSALAGFSDISLILLMCIIGQWYVDSLPRPINRRCANKLCAYKILPDLVVKLHYRPSFLTSIRPRYFLLCRYQHRPWNICQIARPNSVTRHFNTKPSQ